MTKNRGMLSITSEALKELLKIEGDVIGATYLPDREILSIFVVSEEETKHAKPVSEGARIEEVSL